MPDGDAEGSRDVETSRRRVYVPLQDNSRRCGRRTSSRVHTQVSWVVRSASDSVVVVEQTDGRTNERTSSCVLIRNDVNNANNAPVEPGLRHALILAKLLNHLDRGLVCT